MLDEKKKIAHLIDHTLLRQDTTVNQIENLCSEAKKYEFGMVCVNPCYISICEKLLSNTSTKIGSVVGFPLGGSLTTTKITETRNILSSGANEIDMVMNIGLFKSEEYEKVEDDIRSVKQEAGDTIVKVILETPLLTDEEIIKSCQLCKSAGVDFVKTSTGFLQGGATEDHIKLMRNTVGPDMGVKAAGGIKTLGQLKAMLQAGANRIGASSSVAIMKEIEEKEK